MRCIYYASDDAETSRLVINKNAQSQGHQGGGNRGGFA